MLTRPPRNLAERSSRRGLNDPSPWTFAVQAYLHERSKRDCSSPSTKTRNSALLFAPAADAIPFVARVVVGLAGQIADKEKTPPYFTGFVSTTDGGKPV